MTAITQADREAAASGYFAWCSGNPMIHDKMRADARAAIAAIDLPAQREAAASDAYTSTTLSN